MIRSSKYLLLSICHLLGVVSVFAAHTIVVDADGTGDFKTIQAAINNIPIDKSSRTTILIKNGTYFEKLFIEKSNLVLLGESCDSTIISASIARDEWRCLYPDDWGVATINVCANDITLQNITVVNSFGFDFSGNYSVTCPSDSTGAKAIGLRSHQMALRTMQATRLKAIHCKFRSLGGDTVSPWEATIGMWYFKDCSMEGSVDFYCPRGWAWAEDCRFFAHAGTAAIWHDGSAMRSSASVFKNCSFNGYDSFLLGRYHRDAQFYLMDCRFADNMRDSPIYRVPTSNVLQWGHRVFFFNCSRSAGNYNWFSNNLTAKAALAITPRWLFGEQWKPEDEVNHKN